MVSAACKCHCALVTHISLARDQTFEGYHYSSLYVQFVDSIRYYHFFINLIAKLSASVMRSGRCERESGDLGPFIRKT